MSHSAAPLSASANRINAHDNASTATTTNTTTTAAAYTPLESLLLFQALRNSNTIDSTSFSRISDELKKVPLITNDPSYDSGRLSPDALRELYLWLLKDEVKFDLERKPDGNEAAPKTNGDAGDSPGSRKRKAPSPTLPTVSEAAKHIHLLPQLVTRLYVRYRENVIRKIRDQESRHDTLTREVGEINLGKWDDRLRQQNAPASVAPKQPSDAHAHAHAHAQTQPPALRHETVQQDTTKSATASPVAISPRTGDSVPAVHQQPKRYSQAKIDAIVNHGSEQSPSRPSSAGAPSQQLQQHRRSSSNTTLPPLSEMAPTSPRFGVPPKAAHAQAPGPGHGYTHHSPTNSQGSPFLAHHHPGPHMQSPQMSHTASRPSSSPRPILPPPPSMKYPPSVPQQGHVPPQPGMQTARAPPVQHPSQYSPQQYPAQRQPVAPMSGNDRHAGPYSPHPMQPQSPYFQQPQPQYPDRRASYPRQAPPMAPQGYAPQTPTHPNQQGAYMGTPYQVGPQDVNRPHQYPQTVASHPPQYQQHPQQQAQHPLQRPPQPLHQPIQQKPMPYQPYLSNYQQPGSPGTPAPQPQPLHTPATGPPNLRPALNRHLTGEVLQRLGTPVRAPLTPGGRETPLWKSERQLWPIDVPASPPRPIAEPLSPILQKAKPPARRSPSPKVVEDRTRRSRRSASAKAEEAAAQSGSARNSVKDEPVATPATETHDGNDTEASVAPSSPAASRPRTRHRRGTIQSQRSTGTTTFQKRKASLAEQPTDNSSPPPSPRPRHDKVLAARNFGKMSTVIMNEIQSHKHGSRFAHPVRDKDASGYSEIIKRPQDLKSIRAAITAGSRALANVSASDTPAGGNTLSEGIVELDRTEDLVPPKAVVNSAQLEKEVMRMLANAVMFNPGEDGMVADTREMFNDVEGKVRDWRGVGAGDAGGEDEGDGDAGDDTVVEEAGRAKRRKG
ncbi:hypothetical protein K431DRAFT_288849 [Polychaeton citri CBS 116435]|uniref:Bromo domain-containing protein n=1 Tax=Polychaeton citri CBS 116435 TaxID=1314669 RepID=A0A9P4Q255_9PEZI|nr:hypothetical protein K431DRAFT_288849 [Polychaeton citri CBS 116435]